MRKSATIPVLLLLLLLCGCSREEEKQLNSQTRFLLDTVAEISSDCDDETLNGAFVLCEKLEKKLSRTETGSDVYKLNSTDDFVTVSDDTLSLLESALYYGELSGGKFDITICSVSELWDFKNQVIPKRDEIAEALKNVDYHSIQIISGRVSAGDKKIDLGGIAKGYIADRLRDYFTEKGSERTLINLGGNVMCLGKFTVGIKKPFEDTVIATIKLENKTAATSGIYERYIKDGDKLYHHVLDPETGYGVENELASVTVIGESSLDCDALSTICLLLGTEAGKELIEGRPNTEAVFIGRDGSITLSDGLYRENDKIYFNLE